MIPNPAERPTDAIVHPKCGSWWVGRTISHCGSCCETFSGISTFDKHQQVGAEPLCRKPADVGLVAVERPWGRVWCRPGTNGTPALDDEGDVE